MSLDINVGGGLTWKDVLAGTAVYVAGLGVYKDWQHGWVAVDTPTGDPMNPTETVWKYTGPLVLPETAPTGTSIISTDPGAVLDPVGVTGSWTIPALGTPERDYQMRMKLYNDTKGVSYLPAAVNVNVGSITVSAATLSSATGSDWLNSDDVYAVFYYINEQGGSEANNSKRTPAAGYW